MEKNAPEHNAQKMELPAHPPMGTQYIWMKTDGAIPTDWELVENVDADKALIKYVGNTTKKEEYNIDRAKPNTFKVVETGAFPIDNIPAIGTKMPWFGDLEKIPAGWEFDRVIEDSTIVKYVGFPEEKPVRDLVAEYKDNEQVMDGIIDLQQEIAHKKHPRFKTGDTIQFLGGYAGDILFQSKITGFDEDGGIYVVWDCYWFAIKDEVKRQIKLIE